MRLMLKKQPKPDSDPIAPADNAALAPFADDMLTAASPERWAELYDRIQKIALIQSAIVLCDQGVSEQKIDRGARALRMLMSAAEIARKLKLEEQKEIDADDGKASPALLADDELARHYQSILRRVERCEIDLDTSDADLERLIVGDRGDGDAAGGAPGVSSGDGDEPDMELGGSGE